MYVPTHFKGTRTNLPAYTPPLKSVQTIAVAKASGLARSPLPYTKCSYTLPMRRTYTS